MLALSSRGPRSCRKLNLGGDQVTPEHALNNLYQATRQLPAGADAHDQLGVCYAMVLEVIQATSKKPDEAEASEEHKSLE